MSDITRLIDESAIRDVTARFAQAATFGEYDVFAGLWTDDATWKIGKPFEATVEGPQEIVGLLRKLREPKEFFVQMPFQGPVAIDGDEARSRCIVHEEGRGPGDAGFRCHSVTDDILRRSGDTWRFVERSFQYIWLDTAHFPGQAFAVPQA